MTSVKELSELLLFIGKLATGINNALSDGTINFLDLNELLAPVMAAKDAFSDMDKIPAELAELDEEESAYLIALFSREFELDADKAEELVERGLEIAFSLVAYVATLRGTTTA